MSSLCDRFAKSIRNLTAAWADQANSLAGVVRRRRKFDAGTLGATFAFGFLHNPNASAADLARTAGLLGVDVSPQACDRRFQPATARFLRALAELALRQAAPPSATLTPLLRKFSDVTILDSTAINLPATMADEFPGCGGAPGSPAAAMKVQTLMSLASGALAGVRFESSRVADVSTPLRTAGIAAKSLRIQDLGYFEGELFEQIAADDAFWLSPVPTRIKVTDGDRTCELIDWLQTQTGVVDRCVMLGARQVPVRLVAWRLPPAVAAKRRDRLHATAKRRRQKLTPQRLARCDWAILATNAGTAKLTLDEIRALYRARWQIELLFKRWKSQGLLAQTGGDPRRAEVRFWARLLGCVVQQWLQEGLWGRSDVSVKKVWDVVRSWGPLLVEASRSGRDALRRLWRRLRRVVRKTCRQNKRKRANTQELLKNPSKLNHSLS